MWNSVYVVILTVLPSWLLALVLAAGLVMLVVVARRTPLACLTRYEMLILALGLIPLVLQRLIFEFGTVGNADGLLLRNAALSRVAQLQLALAVFYVATASLRREMVENA